MANRQLPATACRRLLRFHIVSRKSFKKKTKQKEKKDFDEELYNFWRAGHVERRVAKTSRPKSQAFIRWCVSTNDRQAKIMHSIHFWYDFESGIE